MILGRQLAREFIWKVAKALQNDLGENCDVEMCPAD
jgi:hypothetical protein